MFDKAMAAFVAGVSGLSILLGFLVVIPLTLWFAWAHQRIDEYSILITLFCLSFFWMFMSMLQCHRSLRQLGLDGEARMRLVFGNSSRRSGRAPCLEVGLAFRLRSYCSSALHFLPAGSVLTHRKLRHLASCSENANGRRF